VFIMNCIVVVVSSQSLMECNCVREIGFDNKHGRSVKAIHSFLSRWRAGTELCAGTQEEPCCKKSSMGSEKRQSLGVT